MSDHDDMRPFEFSHSSFDLGPAPTRQVISSAQSGAIFSPNAFTLPPHPSQISNPQKPMEDQVAEIGDIFPPDAFTLPPPPRPRSVHGSSVFSPHAFTLPPPPQHTFQPIESGRVPASFSHRKTPPGEANMGEFAPDAFTLPPPPVRTTSQSSTGK